ncbi:MAG: helix-turn-helix domain-containing protein [Clostridia bacterium]|nr:helix-turn-helix domain-containing protein [Clostridia bacterium]
MSLLFVNEESLPRVDALVISEGESLTDTDYIAVKPLRLDGADGRQLVGKITELLVYSLDEASRRGYFSLAMRFPSINSRIAYTRILSLNLTNILAPYDIDVYVVIGERERKIIRGILDIDNELYPVMYSRRDPAAPFSWRMASAKSIRPDMFGDECCSAMPDASFEMGEPTPSLVDFIRDMDDSFAVRLLKLIDLRGMDEIKAYKAANVSRQTWYKIMNEKGYRPSKNTVISFAIALRLDLPETQALLATAGFTLSGSILFDKIIVYCIREGIFDVFKINQILYSYDQECLGA